MFAGSDWKCVIVNFLLFCFKNRVKGQIPELHYIKKKKKLRGTGAFIEVSSNNGLLLGS